MEEFRYKGKGTAIVFRPQWIYNNKDNVLDLEIEFVVNEKIYHDHHVMGAFSHQEIKMIAEKIGFEVFVIPTPEVRKGAIFVCRKK